MRPFNVPPEIEVGDQVSLNRVNEDPDELHRVIKIKGSKLQLSNGRWVRRAEVTYVPEPDFIWRKAAELREEAEQKKLTGEKRYSGGSHYGK